MTYNIGVNVIEVDGAGAPAIVGAAVGTGAFNVLTRRGVPNFPVRVTSQAHFEEQFGGLEADSLGAYMVKGFFDNGGQVAWINRVQPDGATPSSLVLADGANRSTLELETGFRGRRDPGSWGGELAVRVAASSSVSTRFRETARASVQGSPLQAATDMSALPHISVTVDGEASPTDIAFVVADFANPAQATPQEIRDAVNRRQTKVAASLTNDNRLVLTSTGHTATVRKTFSSLQVMTAVAQLGLTAGAQPTFGTAAARTQGGTQLASVAGLQQGSTVRLLDGSRTAIVKLTSVQPATGDVTWAPNVANIAQFSPNGTTVSTVGFDLTLTRTGGTQPEVLETWSGLTMEADLPSYAPTRINDAVSGSKYLVASDLGSTSDPGADIPADAGPTPLTPGAPGTAAANDFIGDAAGHTGFYAFDAHDVQLVCCERTDPAVVSAALTYCEDRGDCMFVGAVPEGLVGSGGAVAYGQAFQGAKVYGALFGPWIQVFDPLGSGPAPAKWVPPTGHVMGVFARIAAARGVWKAPAGDEARILGALNVETALSDADHTDLVESGSVNGIRAIPGAGICVDASRTLSTDTRWLYVNVRLLFNYVKSSLKRGLRWVRQEPNRDTLWDAVKYSSVTPYLMGLWRQGAFGTGKPEDVFTVICDATNNPPDQVDQGVLKVEVYFYPSRPAETIVIIVGQRPSGASAAEA